MAIAMRATYEYGGFTLGSLSRDLAWSEIIIIKKTHLTKIMIFCHEYDF